MARLNTRQAVKQTTRLTTTTTRISIYELLEHHAPHVLCP